MLHCQAYRMLAIMGLLLATAACEVLCPGDARVAATQQEVLLSAD
jgi:hypothetical protein